MIERVLFAFGLLEALSSVKLPFIFKGGTNLLLLLDEPRRLSTDIDILVEIDVDVMPYLEQVATIFPFVEQREHVRIGQNKIIKRHFKFFYYSSYTKSRLHILLDIVYLENPYTALIDREIKNAFLLVEEPLLTVRVPTVDCLLGDKLSAFAPKTTGIPFKVGKELEIIKQLHDVAVLFDYFTDYEQVKSTYIKTATKEILFRGLDITFLESLQDTIDACLCIISNGKFNKDDYPFYILGAKKIVNHIIKGRYSAEVAKQQACKVLYLACCLLKDSKFERVIDTNEFRNHNLRGKFSAMSYMKKVNPLAYAYLVKANMLIG